MTRPTQDVDHVRATLRSLGYLDAGVDRFVLGPVRQGRGATAVAFRSSLRIGILVALLLGPAAAIGVSLRVPGLMTGMQDALVVAAYIGVLFGAAAALAAFLAAVVAAALASRPGQTGGFARRARRAASLAGLVTGAACLAYLVLWWRTTAADAGHSLSWTISALAVALAISLLLGHVIATTAMAVIAGAAGAADLRTGVTRRSWRLSAVAGAAAFAGATALLLSSGPGESLGANPADAVSDITVVPTGLRVVVIGLDGFDPGLYKRVASPELTPHLHEIMQGAVAAFAVDGGKDPAAVWTSIATGQPPEVHGIESIETRRVTGLQGSVASERSSVVAAVAAATDLIRLSRPAVASDVERREKTFWEVAAEKGFRTAIVNWWATWPAATGGGIVVTDRAVLRLEHGGRLDAEIAPPSLYGTLQRLWPGIRNGAREQARLAFDDLPDEASKALRRSAELDALQVELASQASIGQPDLVAVYLPGLDIAQHGLLGTGAGRLSPSALAERVEALQRYYPYLDGLIGRLAGDGDPQRLLVVVTHPGRVSGPGRSVLAFSGHEANGGHEVQAKATDLAPTLLYALGLPVSRELAGRPLQSMFAPAFAARYRVRSVDTYGRRLARPVERSDSTLDEEMIERLRSLGYVR
jgi:hypothetical protein